MATAGDGAGQFQDPAARELKWSSERERFAAIAAGVRVIKTLSQNPQYQVQVLELGPGGVVRVAAVVPGDQRHAALYRTLIKPESEWGRDDNGEEDQGAQ